jgi:hypothetical protein
MEHTHNPLENTHNPEITVEQVENAQREIQENMKLISENVEKLGGIDELKRKIESLQLDEKYTFEERRLKDRQSSLVFSGFSLLSLLPLFLHLHSNMFDENHDARGVMALLLSFMCMFITYHGFKNERGEEARERLVKIFDEKKSLEELQSEFEKLSTEMNSENKQNLKEEISDKIESE